MAHMPEMMQLVETWFAAHAFEEVAREFEVYQVPYAPLMSMADIFAEPHYREREMIIDVPESTLGHIPQPGVVPKLSRTPGRVTHAGPSLGAHTEEILTGLLGMSAADIADLRQQGVI
jgi:formyl-CoA transferase